MGLFCMEQKAKDNNISNNQEDALKYLESIPVVKVEDEILFFETLPSPVWLIPGSGLLLTTGTELSCLVRIYLIQCWQPDNN